MTKAPSVRSQTVIVGLKLLSLKLEPSLASRFPQISKLSVNMLTESVSLLLSFCLSVYLRLHLLPPAFRPAGSVVSVDQTTQLPAFRCSKISLDWPKKKRRKENQSQTWCAESDGISVRKWKWKHVPEWNIINSSSRWSRWRLTGTEFSPEFSCFQWLLQHPWMDREQKHHFYTEFKGRKCEFSFQSLVPRFPQRHPCASALWLHLWYI